MKKWVAETQCRYVNPDGTPGEWIAPTRRYIYSPKVIAALTEPRPDLLPKPPSLSCTAR